MHARGSPVMVVLYCESLLWIGLTSMPRKEGRICEWMTQSCKRRSCQVHTGLIKTRCQQVLMAHTPAPKQAVVFSSSNTNTLFEQNRNRICHHRKGRTAVIFAHTVHMIQHACGYICARTYRLPRVMHAACICVSFVNIYQKTSL